MIKAILKTENRSFILENFQAPRGLRENENRPHLVDLEFTIQNFNKADLEKLLNYLNDLYVAMQNEPGEIYFKNARDRFCDFTKMVKMNDLSLTEVDNFLIAYDNAISEIKRLKNK